MCAIDKMQPFLALVIFSLVIVVECGFTDPAQTCTSVNCKIANNCACASSSSPIATSDTPQFVSFTFDDSVQPAQYDTYYQPILFNRYNPDGNHIGATFFVPHDYTDYEKVNMLYNQGFEIAAYSISKNASIDYWKAASVSDLALEFWGQRQIIRAFANISFTSITGGRTPLLQLADNRSIQAYTIAGLRYDNSWTTHALNPLFPYTLDYRSTQPCIIGSCPNASFPGFWIVPINNLVDMQGVECNVLYGCTVTGTTQDVANWLINHFEKVRSTDRHPISILVTASWFAFRDDGTILKLFLDHLATYNDTFVVSQNDVKNWAQNPQPIGVYQTIPEIRDAQCAPRTCQLLHGTETRYMRSCIQCPLVYPWLGDPTGSGVISDAIYDFE